LLAKSFQFNLVAQPPFQFPSVGAPEHSRQTRLEI
jgi:hypothetical protein